MSKDQTIITLLQSHCGRLKLIQSMVHPHSKKFYCKLCDKYFVDSDIHYETETDDLHQTQKLLEL